MYNESLFVLVTVFMFWGMCVCGFVTDSVRYCRGNTLEQRLEALEKRITVEPAPDGANETDPMIPDKSGDSKSSVHNV